VLKTARTREYSSYLPGVNIKLLFVSPQQLMHAIAMVHKMQRLALNNSSSMDVDEAHKCTTIEEEEEVEEGIWVLTNMAYHLDSTYLLDVFG
jgi:exoribonuclease II